MQCRLLRCGRGLRGVRGRQQLCQRHVYGLRVGFLQRRCSVRLQRVHQRGRLDLDLERHEHDGLHLPVQRGLQRLCADLRGVRGR